MLDMRKSRLGFWRECCLPEHNKIRNRTTEEEDGRRFQSLNTVYMLTLFFLFNQNKSAVASW